MDVAQSIRLASSLLASLQALESHMPPYLIHLHRLVEKWSSLGEQTYRDGTRLVGHLQDRGVGAYLHRLFGPMTGQDIAAVEDAINQELNLALKEFYRCHNGCILFDQSLYIFGRRRSYDRSDFDEMACNPFDIAVPAITNRGFSPSGKGIILGKYEDGSLVFMEPDDSVCRVLTTRPRRAANAWKGLGEWLLAEYDRVSKFFDANGRCTVDPLATPPPATLFGSGN